MSTNNAAIEQLFKATRELQDTLMGTYQQVMRQDQRINMLGITVGIMEYKYKMLEEIVVDKGLLTKEEMEALVKEKVEKPVEEHFNKINQSIKEEIEKSDNEDQDSNIPNDSSVILASERFKKEGE